MLFKRSIAKARVKQTYVTWYAIYWNAYEGASITNSIPLKVIEFWIVRLKMMDSWAVLFLHWPVCLWVIHNIESILCCVWPIDSVTFFQPIGLHTRSLYLHVWELPISNFHCWVCIVAEWVKASRKHLQIFSSTILKESYRTWGVAIYFIGISLGIVVAGVVVNISILVTGALRVWVVLNRKTIKIEKIPNVYAYASIINKYDNTVKWEWGNDGAMPLCALKVYHYGDCTNIHCTPSHKLWHVADLFMISFFYSQSW